MSRHPARLIKLRRHHLTETDLITLEARNEMGDISGTDVQRLIDAVRYLHRVGPDPGDFMS